MTMRGPERAQGPRRPAYRWVKSRSGAIPPPGVSCWELPQAAPKTYRRRPFERADQERIESGGGQLMGRVAAPHRELWGIGPVTQ